MNEDKLKQEHQHFLAVSDALVIAMIEAATKVTEMSAPTNAETWVNSFRTIWNNVKAARNNTDWP